MAEYSDPKPDDGFVVRLLVSFQDGFVWGLAPLPVEMSQAAKEPRFEHVNRAKVLKHCAKLAAGLAPDADILDLSKEGWRLQESVGRWDAERMTDRFLDNVDAFLDAVEASESHRFSALVACGGLDPGKDLVFGEFSDCTFDGDDLRQFDRHGLQPSRRLVHRGLHRRRCVRPRRRQPRRPAARQRTSRLG